MDWRTVKEWGIAEEHWGGKKRIERNKKQTKKENCHPVGSLRITRLFIITGCRRFWFILGNSYRMPPIYLISIELPFLKAWWHVLGLNLLLVWMVLALKMLILSLWKSFSKLNLLIRFESDFRLCRNLPPTWLDLTKGFRPKSNCDCGWEAICPRWRPKVGENLSWITPGPVPMPPPADLNILHLVIQKICSVIVRLVKKLQT